MSMELLAFLASTIGIGGSLPQILKILETKDTRALSWTSYFMLLAGSLLWAAYGIVTPVYSIVFWNGLACLLYVSILVLKFRNEKEDLFQKYLAQSHLRFLH